MTAGHLFSVAVLRGGGGGSEARPPEIFLAPSLPPTFIEGRKILNFEYVVYDKYLRIRKMYKE